MQEEVAKARMEADKARTDAAEARMDESARAQREALQRDTEEAEGEAALIKGVLPVFVALSSRAHRALATGRGTTGARTATLP